MLSQLREKLWLGTNRWVYNINVQNKDPPLILIKFIFRTEIYFNIRYKSKNVMSFLQAGTATGTCGTVSWQIEHLDTRLIVMWSVPFNLNIHDSYFAVGMIFNRGRFTSSSYWFNQMYYSEKGANFLGTFVWEIQKCLSYCIA